MITNVRARFSRGVLRPIEPLDLEEGEEVKLSIEDAPQSPGGLASIAAIVKELHKGIPPDAWDDLPRDLAKNKKHYLYGHSREAGLTSALFADAGYWIAFRRRWPLKAWG